MSSYKLTFNGRVATVPNWTGYVSYPQSNTKPYFVFEFSVADFVPTSSLLNKGYIYSYTGTWKQISSSPNRWKLEMNNYSLGETVATQYGFSFLFSDKLVPDNLGDGTCKLIDSGNFDFIDEYGNTCDSFDRMFAGCTGLTYIEPIHWNGVLNIGGMFNDCINVEGGALDQYNWFATYAVNITNHSGTFTNCGSDTQTGVADLAQIPVGWGGTLVPASTLMGSKKVGNFAWAITGTAPAWPTVPYGMYLFTEASISKYAGVNMRKSNITKIHNGLSTSTNTYYYPAFVQYQNNSTANMNLEWITTTDNYNGTLNAYTTAGDMPGTLDYSTYGPFTREYGHYEPTGTVCFTFLVTNVPISAWQTTEGYGVLSNTNFSADAKLRYFF
jgi:hypothetical protein